MEGARFQLFGFPVTIRPGFVVIIAVIAFLYGGELGPWLAGSLAVFTLVHELGHAWMARRFGATAAIALADIIPFALPLVARNMGGMAAAVGGHDIAPARTPRSNWFLAPLLTIAVIFTLQCLRIEVPLIGSGWARRAWLRRASRRG